MDNVNAHKVNEEAVKKIAERVYDNGSTVINRNDLEEMFPALKESGDERIRKVIADIVKAQPSDSLFNGTKEKCLAWLEKQGEQKPNFCHHEVDFSGCSEEYRKAYYDGWNNCNQQHAQLEAEQKPAWSEEVQEEQVSEEFINALGTMLNDGLPDRYLVSEERIKKSAELLFSIARKQLKNEKQEWSEEDDKIIEEIINDIECARAINYHAPKEGYEFRENWLKSFKERVPPYPKQEWTIYDEEELRIALNTLREAGQNDSAHWLKNVCLIPQNTWKPSDEQIYWLKWAVNRMPDTEKANEAEAVLEDLLEQLKKLMEK